MLAHRWLSFSVEIDAVLRDDEKAADPVGFRGLEGHRLAVSYPVRSRSGEPGGRTSPVKAPNSIMEA